VDYDREAYEDEKSDAAQPRQFSGFAIGRYPVTVWEYEEYLRASGRQADPAMEWEGQARYPNRPLVNVTHAEASAYCAWLSEQLAGQAGGGRVRLPTEWEWEFAARGPGNAPRRYPWGSEAPDGTRANFRFEGSPGRPTPVGLFPRGATPGRQEGERIYDLAGNVLEWTGSLALRGGAYYYFARYLRAADRNVNVADGRSSYFGFRCLREEFP
jgi:formylglycine-generating enzyme required for sulfatase activity